LFRSQSGPASRGEYIVFAFRSRMEIWRSMSLLNSGRAAYRVFRVDNVHFHINWSGSGFGRERFTSYAEAHDVAYSSVGEGGVEETFAIELCDEPCPVCAMHDRKQS
jgi:hypothetical protein